jgi:hypothetical protein
MNRLSVVAVKRAVIGMSLALAAIATPRVAMAQAPDPLKFSSSQPVIIGWVIKADKTADFEAAWAGIKALLAKSDKDELKAFGQTIELFRIEGDPFDHPTPNGPIKVVMYAFNMAAPSTTHSYNPLTILYDYLAAGKEGSTVTRAEADDLYTAKIGGSYVTIQPLWKLKKIGG